MKTPRLNYYSDDLLRTILEDVVLGVKLDKTEEAILKDAVHHNRVRDFEAFAKANLTLVQKYPSTASPIDRVVYTARGNYLVDIYSKAEGLGRRSAVVLYDASEPRSIVVRSYDSDSREFLQMKDFRSIEDFYRKRAEVRELGFGGESIFYADRVLYYPRGEHDEIDADAYVVKAYDGKGAARKLLERLMSAVFYEDTVMSEVKLYGVARYFYLGNSLRRPDDTIYSFQQLLEAASVNAERIRSYVMTTLRGHIDFSKDFNIEVGGLHLTVDASHIWGSSS